MICGSGGSKSRLAKAAGAEAAGQMRDEKLHAVVARSTFRSEKVQNTSVSDHFWKLRCRKSARRCGAKQISKWTCTKHLSVEPRLEVVMSKMRTPLWRETHFEVKMYKTPQCRTTFGSCDVEKVHAVVARSTFRSEHVQNTRGSDHFWRFRCRFASLHYTTLHYTTLHYTTLHYITLHNTTLHYTTTTTTQLHKYTPLHSTSLNYTTLHYITLHSTTLHYITLHYTTFHYTSLHYTKLHSTTLQQLQLDTLHYTPLHSTTLHLNCTTLRTLHYTTLHYITLHYTTLHYATLPSTTLHYITLHSTTLQLQLRLHNYTPLHSTTLSYTTLHYTTLHYLPLHSTTLHYTTLHYTEWHCTTDRQVHSWTDR